MSYSPKIIEQIKALPPNLLGAQLGRWAVYLDISAVQIASATGATRQSVYNWLRGGEIFVAYRPSVRYLIEIMKTCKTSEEAWSKICQAFNLNN
jgi:hypothetical protein